jgi:DNA polymerase-3 subunit epsilon
VPDDRPFVDKTLVFTGALPLRRADAAQPVLNAGGHVANKVSKEVDFLVLGMQDAWKLKDGVHSSKMLKAAEMLAAGVPIEVLSEDDFLRMLPG